MARPSDGCWGSCEVVRSVSGGSSRGDNLRHHGLHPGELVRGLTVERQNRLG